ncbi:MAG: hypothetical protein HQ541_15100 [Mariniphaga sp.]|nr:hypothetical protein [Mariniphaga sp.]
MSNESKNNSKGLLAFILIFIGSLWLLKQLGIYINFPNFHFHDFFHPFRNAFHNFWHLIFSWQTILIIVGLILLAGKRSTGGLILIIIGGLFLLPQIFILPGITAVLIFPIVLIGIGVALIARII